MATKVKPCRLQATGTPQAGNVPVYVDADTFQWGAGGGGNVKSFTLSSTSDLTNAQAAYDWYDDGNVAIIIYNDKEYLFDYATAGNAYWSVANEESFDAASATGMRRAALQLALSSGTVTGVTTLNISINDLKVLRTDKNYGTPYTPQYDGSPATKKYVDDKSTIVSSSAPVSPTEGMLWYDTTNDVLKTYDGSNWNATGGGSGDVVGPASATDGHLALFDGNTGKLIKDGGVVPTGVPAVGTDGQVLTVVSGASAWANLPSAEVQVSTQANNILSSGMKIRCGEETDYANLGSYSNDTLYLTIPDQS